MNELDLRSIRVLVDLQACQTADSAYRGVGRYSEALFKAMVDLASPREVYGILGAQHKIKPDLKKFNRAKLLIAPPLPSLKTGRFFSGGEQDVIDSMMHSAAASTVSPDLIHISHIFEGFTDRVAIPHVLSRPAGQVVSATLYDLIPLRYQEYYFKNLEFKKWYFHRISFYRQADLLLAISEASRQDAIELLGIAPEKIVTIMGGVSENFRPADNLSVTKEDLRCKYQLNRPGIVLYIGGDDYRKNLAGAIDAFALLPNDVRAVNQLVIVCALEEHRKDFFESLSRKAGLKKDDVAFLGFVPEDDLVALYGACDAFLFPSLYEGLGFPVLEAMACGAPVLCGNNSSLVELVDRRDATFDSASPSSITERLRLVLTDKTFAQSLRDYGIERAKLFSWPDTAKRALDAFDEALSRKRKAAIHAANAGLLPKPRMAMLTPLPPCRSGIADYNAEFLPYLASHFEIDLFVDGYKCTDTTINATFRIFDVGDFRKSADSYDVILYEFGNSEFHQHMLALLEDFPGVVGLHDAFLSGLMAHFELSLWGSDQFSREMFYSHGSIARRLFAPLKKNPDAVGEAVINLPCTKRVIDRSIGIISHSKFNLEVAQLFYPEGFNAPYRIIPQLVKTKNRKSVAEISEVKSDLGFARDDFVIATFGHVAWTKWGDLLLQAFLESELAQDPKCHLVFAGELANDEFGLSLKDSIRKSGLKARIKITGYLSDDIYQKYICVTDIAVQLRTKSRGGTPRGVLDCMAHGVPVVINNAASYKDYPNSVVAKLSEQPDVYEIARTLLDLQLNPKRRNTLGELGYQYVKTFHNPENLAAHYAAAIHEFMARHKATSVRRFIDDIAPHLSTLPNPRDAVKPVSKYLENRPRPCFQKSRLIVDCSYIAKADEATGIPRVVKETVRAAYCSHRHGFETIAIQRDGDRIVPAIEWLDRQRLLLPYEVNNKKISPVEFGGGDYLLMLDSSWHEYDDFGPVFAEARKAYVPITTVVYDLLPIKLPPGNIVSGGKEWFDDWLQRAVMASDSLICISKSVADDLIEYIKEKNLVRHGLKVGWWHLGSTPLFSFEPSTKQRALVAPGAPFCLMVGTIEPRKNHALALDAFEHLWFEGSELKLVIAGKPGWLVDDLMERLRSHCEFGKRLIVLENVADTDLDSLYRSASMLLFISKGEGFGLPLVEAAQYNRPLVCSRIPSFIEIARDHAIFVGIDSPRTLANELANAWRLITLGAAPNSGSMQKLTWEESTEALLKVVIDQNWYWQA